MTQATAEAPQAPTAAGEFAFDRGKDRARMRRIGGLHFVLVMGALTLWGAADAWAAASGWALAQGVAIANAIIAGYIISSTLHEWGHFAGARLSGAVAPVLAKPARYFFMFDFKFERNDVRQFLWLSLGGILAPWLCVAAVLLLVPIDTASRAMLLATFLAQAVTVVWFEGPVTWRAYKGIDPQQALRDRLDAGGISTGRYVGLALGAVVFLAA